MSGINVRADLSIFSTIDSRPFLKSISCPVLMLRGEFDWIVPKDRVDNTAAKLAETTHLEYETLHGVGHFPPLEAPELVGSLMAKFLHENL
jgi:pimeloyl-ACP methyl ester carboxylesterase